MGPKTHLASQLRTHARLTNIQFLTGRGRPRKCPYSYSALRRRDKRPDPHANFWLVPGNGGNYAFSPR
jgi:hypothetical protein